MGSALVTVVGKLSKDVDLRFLPDGRQIAQLSIPVQKGKDKPTTWYQVSSMGRKIENEAFVKLLRKGAVVSASGELEIKTYTKQDGSQGMSVNVFAITLNVESYAPKSETEDIPTEETPDF